MYIPVYIKMYLCINICIYTQCVCVYISIYGGARNGVWTSGILQAFGILWLQTCSILQEKGRMTPKAVQDHQGFLWPKGHSPSSVPQSRVSSSVSESQLPEAVVSTKDRASRQRFFSHALKASVIYPARFQTCFLKFAFFFFSFPL